MNWKKLQNGSDIRGVALEGIEGEHVNLTPAVIETIAKAFVAWLRKTSGVGTPTIAVGTDCRLSGNDIKAAFVKGAVEVGANVVDCGLASTPAMFMTTINEQTKATASVMVTASHLPFNRNGLKFFTPKGGLDSKDIATILAIAESGDYAYSGTQGSNTALDFMAIYSRHIADYICEGVNADDYAHPLQGMHIIVDAGNGNGGFFEKILSSLGANTEGSQFLTPDGHFPNHIPNPEDKAAMASVCKAVESSNADLGVIFDTDVDRAGAVLSDGSELNRNRIIAMLSAILLREHPGTTIVTDSITSTGLAAFIRKHGGVHHRFKRGYRNVINESMRLNREGHDSQLAMETSGHGALKENYFLDDGAYLVTRLLIELARAKKEGYTLESLIADLAEPAESKEFRMNILVPDFKAYGQKIIDELNVYAASQPGWSVAPDNFEGVRVNLDKAHGDGWFLLRLSLHDPLIPLNIESDSVGGVRQIAAELAPFLRPFDQLDTSALLAFAGC